DYGAKTDVGAITWGNGTAGVKGVVSAANSFIGSSPADSLGYSGGIVLANGHYVVRSPLWDNGAATDAGAVTWFNGTNGHAWGRSTVSGTIDSTNSLVGSSTSDAVGQAATLLNVDGAPNGNLVIASPNWNNGASTKAGAATFMNGSAASSIGKAGVVSAANSLVGGSANDCVGSGGVTALSNGAYVVSSPNWVNGTLTKAGAATWGNATTGVVGTVSASNSLVGRSANDLIGIGGVYQFQVKAGEAPSYDYVVRSPYWNGGTSGEISKAGALTWGNGTTGTTGTVSATNSAVGAYADQQLGMSMNFLPASKGLVVTVPSYNDGFWMGGLVVIGKPGAGGPGGDPVSSATFGANASANSIITPESITALLNAGTAVTLQANNDITVSEAITATGTGAALTLQAGRSLLINDSITTKNKNLTLIANETTANGVVDAQRDAGAAVITVASGKTLDAGTGAINITLANGAGKTNATSGAITLGAITAGSLSVNNAGPTAGSGISLGATTLSGALTLQSTNGDITQSGALSVTGATGITAGTNNVTLNHAANNFGTVSVVSGNNVSLRDSNALDLGSSTVSGNLDLLTGGALTQSGALT
ncbi:MAG: hypothetical protein N2439_16975, partial [Anaerolineae bacterium]|nr:hypothetical protein [Anaerolineae bacterium]